jgi:2-haloacid dehalogenase
MIKAFVFDAYGTLYDVHSIVTVAEDAYPGHGEIITQIWRLKQLEYSWLRSLMDHYRDFRSVTEESLAYTLGILGLPYGAASLERLTEAYHHLTPYPEAAESLAALKGYRRAIVSNGTQNMLDALVRNTGLSDHLEAVLSVDDVRAFKPNPRAYTVVGQRLGVTPEEVVFVTSNGFDVAGARAFGFHVARVERVTPEALRQELAREGPIGVATLYRALRSQNETLGFAPSIQISSLLELPGVVSTIRS